MGSATRRDRVGGTAVTTLLYTLGVAIFVVALGASIALHEVGHLLPAKRFGVKVTQYMIGFGPTIASWRRGETEYGIKGVPLGGYVKMIGMFPPRPGEDDQHLRDSSTGAFQTLAEDARRAGAEEIQPGDEDRVFYKLPVAKKVTVMLGGPVMNLLLAIGLFTVLIVGLGDPRAPQITTTVDTVSLCMAPATEAKSATADCDEAARTPASKAGLLPGDRIVAMNGVPIDSWQTERELIRTLADTPVPLVVERDGRRLTLTITPVSNTVYQLDAQGEPVLGPDGTPLTTQAGFIGVSPQTVYQTRPLTAVPSYVWEVFTGSVDALVHLPQRMVDVAQAAFGTEARDPNGPIGIVGVGRITGEAVSLEGFDVREKASLVVGILGSLNMFLFVLNLVPLLPLDGGHVAGALWEGLRRRIAALLKRPDPGPVDVAKALPLVYVMSALLIAMSLMLLYADIVRPIRLGG
jgi:membrane-associated protease RseP (regulator of RpoE activity)